MKDVSNKPKKILLFVAVLALLAAAGGAGVVRAQENGIVIHFPLMMQNSLPAVQSALDLYPQSGPAGMIVTVAGRSFAPNLSLQVGIAEMDETPAAWTPVTTSATGTFTATLTIPETAAAGTQWFVHALPQGQTVPVRSSAFHVIERPEEDIFIRQPAPGSRVTNPVRVEGIAGPTFEQNLVVRVVTADGTQVALTPTIILAPVGERGEFAVNVHVDLDTEEPIFIQVYHDSARDGGILHLSSTSAIFDPDGPANVLTATEQPEQISILYPTMNTFIHGGVAHVAGYGLATFEQTLVIAVLDENGDVVGSQSVLVGGPGLGTPGPFYAAVPYTVTTEQHGRILVRDISPAFGGSVHVSTVEVILQP
jgi:hypothetical protein